MSFAGVVWTLAFGCGMLVAAKKKNQPCALTQGWQNIFC